MLSRKLAALALCLVGPAMASETIGVGSLLSDDEIASKVILAAVSMDGETFKLLSTSVSEKQFDEGASPSTLLVNERGLVGKSLHNVVISEVKTSLVQERLSSLSIPTIASSFYEHMDISKLRFDTFADAVAARSQLLDLLPGAQVHVPIKYAVKRPK